MSADQTPSRRSALSRARGLGSAKSGTGHFLAQRWTAVALVPLIIWFVIGIIAHVGADYKTAVAWIGQPLNAVLMVLMLGALFHHAQLGLQIVIEDYVHGHGTKIAAIVLTKGAALLFGGLAIFAVLRISLGGAA